MAQQSLQQMQPGFNAFQQNERLQPQISALSGIDGAPVLPDFSITNQFGGNPFQRASGMLGLGGGGNPFGMSAGAALAASSLPSFGGATAGGGGGGAAGALNAAAQKIAASSDKLVAALDKLTAALGGGGPGSGPGAPGMPSAPGRPGASPLMSRLGMGIGATFTAGLSAYNFGTQQIGLEANAMAAQNAEVFFNQGLGGLGSTYRGMNVNQQVTAAQRDSMGNTVQGVGIGAMVLGGASMLVGGALSLTGVGASVGIPMMTYGGITLGVGGGVAAGGGAITNRAGEEARRNAEDRNSAAYQAALAKDRALQNARRSASLQSAFTVNSFYNALAQNPGGEGTAAVYRAGRYARTAARASALSSTGDMIIPFEQQGFNFLNNISMNPGRFNDVANGGFFQTESGVQQLQFGGVAGKDPRTGKLKYESGLFGGRIAGNMTDYTGQMTQALGLTNMQAINELNAIVGAQGFRGIGADFYNGFSRLGNPVGSASSIAKAIQKQGAAAFIRTPRSVFGNDPERSEESMMFELRMNAGQAFDNRVGQAGARLMGGLNAVYSNYYSIGDINSMAAQISGVNDPAGLLRSPNNINTTMSEIIRARQLGFSAQTIGLMARTGQGGLGTQAFLSTRQLTGETEFLGLRGSGAQAYIQGRSSFLENFANRGINLRATLGPVDGFASAQMAEIGMTRAAATGKNPAMFIQPGFGVNNDSSTASNQLLGEIATVMNRGRANRMQSFMGAQYGNRANEMMMGNASVENRLRGVLGGFGEEILFTHFLAASGGNVEQALRMAQTAGPLTKRNIIAGVGGGDKAFTREGLISMGMSPDTATVIANAPNVLENLPQKEREILRNAMSGSAAAAKGESEVQAMARFNRTNFRIMKISEAMKIAMEGTALDIAEILSFLKRRFGSGGGRRRKPKPAPAPDPYNFDEMSQEEIDALSDEEDIDGDPGM